MRILTISRPSEGASLSHQSLFVSTLLLWKPVKGGTLDYYGISAFEPIAGVRFIPPSVSVCLFPFEGEEHRSLVPSSYPPAIMPPPPLALKHGDNAEVDQATCTASSASTSLQTESIQDIRVPYL